MRSMRVVSLLVLLAAMLSAGASPASASDDVVRAVLFYSPNCGHCHYVMEEVLPPLQQSYGGQLQILSINVTEESGYRLYQNALAAFQVPDDRLGVPMLIIGTNVLVGSREIPEQLPSLIQSGIVEGGIHWPEIPGLETWVQPVNGIATENQGWWQQMQSRFVQDKTANIIAVLVLIGLIASLVVSVTTVAKQTKTRTGGWQDRVAILLALAGLAVAVYLSYVETTHSQAICGPVGDCNTVQTSRYAYLFGVVPVGVLGAAGYLAILALLLLRQHGPPGWRNPVSIGIWGIALFGTLFSTYLTFLEPFVIGATCAWCLTSAVLMGLILILTTPLARSGLSLDPVQS